MPKRKPDSVIVHRHELGTWERQQLGPTILATNLTIFATGAGIVAGGAGIGLAGYAAWRWLSNNAGIKWLAENDEWLGKAWGVFLRINPATGWYYQAKDTYETTKEVWDSPKHGFTWQGE